MTRNGRTTLSILAVGLVVALTSIAGEENGKKTGKSKPEIHVTLDEARGQAEVLHETMETTLQLIHRRYYREDEGLPIPSLSMEEIFKKLESDRDIKFRWLAVNAQPMNVDHRARDDFERAAVKELAAGKGHHDAVEDGVYRRAGSITLFSQCLKCHVPNRTSTESRIAGLVISIPFRKD